MPTLQVAYVDTETTGLSSRSDAILEIGVVLAEVDWATGAILRTLDRYEGLQDPGRAIPWGAFAVHGITDAMVKGRRIDAARVDALLRAADIRLAHNSGFDKGFVSQVVPEAADMLWGCTCRGIPWRRLYAVPTTALQELSRFFGCRRGVSHRALGDVETTMNLVGLPGILGGLTFQHYLLHSKVRRLDLERQPVALPDPAFRGGLRG